MNTNNPVSLTLRFDSRKEFEEFVRCWSLLEDAGKLNQNLVFKVLCDINKVDNVPERL